MDLKFVFFSIAVESSTNPEEIEKFNSNAVSQPNKRIEILHHEKDIKKNKTN
jgi:hypothetical protein